MKAQTSSFFVALLLILLLHTSTGCDNPFTDNDTDEAVTRE